MARVYDATGRCLHTLADERHAPGVISLEWAAKSSMANSGVYFLRFEARPVDGSAPLLATRKVVLVK